MQIGTGEAVNPFPAMPDYAAFKAALLNLTASLAKHLDRTGITVNTVSPGIVITVQRRGPGAWDQPPSAAAEGHDAPGPVKEPVRSQRPGPTREGSNTMTEASAPHGTASTLPPPSANGSRPPPPPAPQAPPRGRLRTRISGMRSGLIAGFAALIVVVIFLIQNPTP